MNHKYDYIIIGAGAAGLSLVHYILDSGLSESKVLIIDRDSKETNDRTWCFWEKEVGPFESIIHKCWGNANFKSKYHTEILELSPFVYKMIRGADFYGLIKTQISKNPNIEFLLGEVSNVLDDIAEPKVVVDGVTYASKFVFDSRFSLTDIQLNKKDHLTLQHFKGWFIKTSSPSFDPNVLTFMDFDIPQKGGTRFMYVLPFSEDRALVEFTLFTPDLLEDQEYIDQLKIYINQELAIEDYEIEEEEFGVIPMSTAKFNRGDGRVLKIGTTGGLSKGSTGFTFQRIQEDCKEIVQGLMSDSITFRKSSQRFSFYDEILLNVLATNKLSGEEVFGKLFKRNSTETVLSFLNEKTRFNEELGIMMKSPTLPFTKAFFEQL